MEEKPYEGSEQNRRHAEPLPSPPPPSPPAAAAAEPLYDLSGVEVFTGGGDAISGDQEPIGGGDGPPSGTSPIDREISSELPGEIEEPPSGDTPPVEPGALSEELRDRIVRQVEYYFSDENLSTDSFLLKHIKNNKEGFVPISLIASFRRMKKLVQDNSLIESALRTSSKLAVSTDGKKIKRLHPLTSNTDDAKVHLTSNTDDVKLRTILVKNLPVNCSEDYIRNNFGSIGKIKKISIQGHRVKAFERIPITLKLHAYVEYETVEAAMNAVTSLNDESDWRNGLRVEPVLKQVAKHGKKALKGQKEAPAENHDASSAPNTVNGLRAEPVLKQVAKHGKKTLKGQKEAPAENRDASSAPKLVSESDVKPVDKPTEVVEQEDKHSSQENNELKQHCKRRGRAQQRYHVEGHGRGNVNGARIECLSRPVWVPRMPDGTRGFTMGRGKPIVMDQVVKEDG